MPGPERCNGCKVGELLASVGEEDRPAAERAVNLLSGVLSAQIAACIRVYPKNAYVTAARLGLALGEVAEARVLQELHPELEAAVVDCETGDCQAEQTTSN